MKIIISPAKKMKVQSDVIESLTVPIFECEAKSIANHISELSFEELKTLFKANDDITNLNFQRYKTMNFKNPQTPAILAYDGLQYKYMAPSVFENDYFSYLQSTLRILSGLYGVLKPLDGVTPYRLEMQAKLNIENSKNLYDYWSDKIYNAEFKDCNTILNLASSEYSKSIKKYVSKTQTWIDVVFGEISNGKIIEKGAYVKMARGEMVRYMAENNVSDVSKIKNFNRLSFVYNESLSSENKYVFIKEKNHD